MVVPPKIRVKILKSDAQKANYFNSKDCPLARALHRMGFEYVKVGGWECIIDGERFSFPDKPGERGAWNHYVMKQLARGRASFRWLTLTRIQ